MVKSKSEPRSIVAAERRAKQDVAHLQTLRELLDRAHATIGELSADANICARAICLNAIENAGREAIRMHRQAHFNATGTILDEEAE